MPHPDEAKLVTSQPYDVLSSTEARHIVKDNNSSFLRVIKPEIDFPNNDETIGEELHQHAAKNLDDFIKNGILLHDKKDSFYIYQISMGAHTQTGIIGLASVKEYDNSLIKKHEYTRPDKEDDRTCHIDVTNANTGPVFLTFRNDGKFQNILSKVLIKKEDISFRADDSTNHSIWKINDQLNIEMIKSYFSTVSCLYIADGHHRAASASRVQKIRRDRGLEKNSDAESNYFLSAIFPHDEVQILGYNRVITDLAGLTVDQFILSVKEKFHIEELTKAETPGKRFCFTMYLNRTWYRLEAKKKILSNDSIKGLDAAILQDHIFDPILNIVDPRISNRIDFVGGIRGLCELERRCELDAKVAFALYPVTIEQLLKVSDDGKVMPPKSTWFEPKLRSGLVVRLLD